MQSCVFATKNLKSLVSPTLETLYCFFCIQKLKVLPIFLYKIEQILVDKERLIFQDCVTDFLNHLIAALNVCLGSLLWWRVNLCSHLKLLAASHRFPLPYIYLHP